MARGRGYVQNAQERLRLAKSRAKAGARGRGRGKSPRPWDSQAQRESAELGAESADARSGLSADYDRAQRELGFGVGADDPYSATGQNREQLTRAARGITNTAGNNLYAGSTANAQSQARGEFDQQQKGLEDEFARAQSAYASGTARTTRDEQIGSAAIKEGAIERRAATEPQPLGVGAGRRGRGRINEGQNVRRPAAARAMNAQARKLTGGRAGRGRGRI